ncbi:MAG: hypothetical protein IJC37_00800 [Clostridia bacterium]|nr:hypothetical protein [Clostridia bacterium]
MQKVINYIIGFITAVSLALHGLPYAFVPTLEFDAAETCGEISTRATGYLYGIAESGVPDPNVVESIDISSVSQKVIGGLQHPIGDVDHASPQLENCDYIVVYLQDAYDTWYYCAEEIAQLRKAGNYDCMEFMRQDFLPRVREKVSALCEKDYADRLVFCPYNECDNAVWFGTESEDGTWYMFDEAARMRFYEAWKETYNVIKSIFPDALIGGPGYCDYSYDEIYEFLDYCKKNSCVPEVMIYHELSDTSSLYWQDHVDEYRSMERELSISELPVIITEYGTMQECGAPSDMLKYMVKIEESGVYANVAYWRLANNLCDTAADNNTPNSNWWLYRWYADMEGERLKLRTVDVLHADFANVIKYNRDKFHYSRLTGLGSISYDQEKINILCGASDYASNIVVKNLNSAPFKNGKVDVKIEAVYYEGLSGAVYEPVTVKEYTDKVSLFGRLKIRLDSMDPTAVYHVTVTPSQGEERSFVNTNLPVRYEFEEGTIYGYSYTYDSAYATTGLQSGMVGGLERAGDAVEISFDIPESGEYDLSIIFGNSNDGRVPDDRTHTLALMTLDSVEAQISFPNTVKSEYTDKYVVSGYFEKGIHTLKLAHLKGTFVVDSLLVKPALKTQEITVLPDADRSVSGIASFLAVAPEDGYYCLAADESAVFTVDSAYGATQGGKACVYLRRGLNYIDFKNKNVTECVISRCEAGKTDITVSAADMQLSDGAFINNGSVDGIDADSGKACARVNVENEGSYRITITYSNNDEGGVHAYNVDLIERFITVTVNGKTHNVWCRNTYSWDTFKTVTVDVELSDGENLIEFTNDGSVSFNGKTPCAPRISGFTVNETVK